MKWLLTSAVLLAIGMIAAGVTAGRTLRERDEAVREGVLVRAAHEIERELRENGPESAARVLRGAVSASAAAAVELYADERLIAAAGSPLGKAVETPLFLGPSWRAMAGGSGRGHGQPPFRLRLWAAAGVGDSSRVAALAAWGSIAAALALLAFAAAAARGIAARNREAAIDSERQQLEAVALAGAGLAHRIRNPLATIKATAQLLEEQLDAPRAERAGRIVEASLRIESLVSELLRFARPVEVRSEEIDLALTVRSVFPEAISNGVVRAFADRDHVVAAVEELIANARVAGGSEPEVVVRGRGRTAIVEVLDRGPGLQIDPDRAFEPYVTTRPDGTGLGLSTVRALIRANGGNVTLTNRESGGCVATVIVPAASP